jgi:hypothetical protein
VTCLIVPLDVFNNNRPPETQEQSSADRIHSLVTKVVVRFFQNAVATCFRDYQLVLSLRVASP